MTGGSSVSYRLLGTFSGNYIQSRRQFVVLRLLKIGGLGNGSVRWGIYLLWR